MIPKPLCPWYLRDSETMVSHAPSVDRRCDLSPEFEPIQGPLTGPFA